MANHQFTESEIAAVHRVIAERRDMRHFLPTPAAPEMLTRILNAAHLAPSVRFMQPWSFISISDNSTRRNIHQLVDKDRKLTAQAIGRNDHGE